MLCYLQREQCLRWKQMLRTQPGLGAGCCSPGLSAGAMAGTDQGWPHAQEREWPKDPNLQGQLEQPTPPVLTLYWDTPEEEAEQQAAEWPWQSHPPLRDRTAKLARCSHLPQGLLRAAPRETPADKTQRVPSSSKE